MKLPHPRGEMLPTSPLNSFRALLSDLALVPQQRTISTIDALRSEERHQAYRIIGLDVHLAPDGSFELSGDVVSFSKIEILSA